MNIISYSYQICIFYIHKYTYKNFIIASNEIIFQRIFIHIYLIFYTYFNEIIFLDSDRLTMQRTKNANNRE